MINFAQWFDDEEEKEKQIPESDDSGEVFEIDHRWDQFEVPGRPNIRLCLRAKIDELYAQKHTINHIIGQYYVLWNDDHHPTSEDLESGYHWAYQILSRSAEWMALRHPKTEFIISLPTEAEIDRYLAPFEN